MSMPRVENMAMHYVQLLQKVINLSLRNCWSVAPIPVEETEDMAAPCRRLQKTVIQI
jgi:hypothetical protein